MEKIIFENNTNQKGIVDKLFVELNKPVKEGSVIANIITSDQIFEIVSSISGVVKELYVFENKVINSGDILMEIDIQKIHNDSSNYDKTIGSYSANSYKDITALDSKSETEQFREELIEKLLSKKSYDSITEDIDHTLELPNELTNEILSKMRTSNNRFDDDLDDYATFQKKQNESNQNINNTNHYSSTISPAKQVDFSSAANFVSSENDIPNLNNLEANESSHLTNHYEAHSVGQAKVDANPIACVMSSYENSTISNIDVDVDVTDIIKLIAILRPSYYEQKLNLTLNTFITKIIYDCFEKFSQLKDRVKEIKIGCSHLRKDKIATTLLPSVHDEHIKSIARMWKDLKPTEDEDEKCNFVFYNLTSCGITKANIALKPHQFANITFGVIYKKPVIANPQAITARNIMNVTLNYREDIIDFDLAVKFIHYVATSLSKPGLLV